MKKLSNNLFYAISIIFLVLSSFSYAELMISPTRVLFKENSRTSDIVLINSGDQPRSYRIDWEDYVALSQGGYRSLTIEEKANYTGLSRLVRVSPKQVTLAPGQRQSVRLLIRNGSNLPTGEYRSHLVLTALPNKNPGKSGINIDVLFSYSMPVIFRSGTVIVSPEISEVSLVYKKDIKKTFVKVDLYHNDLFSSHGQLEATWTPKNGTSRIVSMINGFNFYPETKTASVQLPWKDFKLEPGTLEVRYEGQAEFSGLLLGQKTLTITQQMINSIR